MPLLTPAKPQTPAQLARAQIEQALSDGVAESPYRHEQIGQMLDHSTTGATRDEIIAEFGEDAPLLLAARQIAEQAIVAIKPEAADKLAAQNAQAISEIK